jgi:hypothetical protein
VTADLFPGNLGSCPQSPPLAPTRQKFGRINRKIGKKLSGLNIMRANARKIQCKRIIKVPKIYMFTLLYHVNSNNLWNFNTFFLANQEQKTVKFSSNIVLMLFCILQKSLRVFYQRPIFLTKVAEKSWRE